MRKGSMPCPQCGSEETGVVSTFRVFETRETVRRRKCANCDYRWYTVQEPEEPIESYRLIFHRPYDKNVQLKEILR